MRYKINMMKIQTLTNLFTGIITMVIQLGVSFFLSSFIVKNIGEAANGFTQLANNFVSYATLITLAFNSMASRFIAVSVHKGDKNKANIFYSSVVVCNVFISLIMIPIAIYIVWNIDSIIVLGDSKLLDVQLLFACVFVNYFFSLAGSIYSIAFYVVNKVYIQNLINLVRHVANASLLLLVFGLFPPKMYYVSMIACVLTFLTIPCYAIVQKKNMPYMKFRFSYFSLSTVIELVKSGLWNTINQCGNLLMTGLDLLLSNLYISPVAMGWLAISKTIPSAIIQLATVLNTSFAPSLTKNWAQDKNDKLLSQLRQSMKISSITMSIPIITFCVFSVDFYKLWMSSIDAGMLAKLSFLSCFSLIPWAGPQILYNVFTTTNKLKANSLTFLVSGFVNLGVVAILLKNTDLGVYAVAGVSSIISVIRNFVFTAPYTAKLLKLKWYTFYYDVVFSLVCCIINAAVGLVIRNFVDISNWFALVLVATLTAVLSLIFEVIIAIDRKEWKKIKEYMINKKRGSL